MPLDLSPELSAYVARVFDIQPKLRCVVRVSNSTWVDERGIHTRRDINFLKRLSTGVDLLRYDCLKAGEPQDALLGSNIDQCADGVYEVRVLTKISDSYDSEEGWVDISYLQFIPYKPERKATGA